MAAVRGDTMQIAVCSHFERQLIVSFDVHIRPQTRLIKRRARRADSV